jgi:hypothetical protein
MAEPADAPPTPRDLMAPDTEPTDEELALVMRAARDLAIQRRALSDAWIAARLEEARRIVRENRARLASAEPDASQTAEETPVSREDGGP